MRRATLLAMLALPLTYVPAANAADMVTVTMTAIVEHPALNADRDGVIEALAQAGYKQGANLKIEFETAQGSPATAAQIARKFVGENPAVIVPISTPSAQAVVAATKTIPIVFSAVTDPVAAQIVPKMEKPGGNVTGVSDFSPLGDHLDLIREITPKVKKLGVVYNPGEANSVALIKALHELAPQHGFELVESPATKSADVQQATRSLVGRVDAIYLPTDNTVASAVQAAASVGGENKIPIYAGDIDMVKGGCLATSGFDYHHIGVQTGEIVARVLKGEKPGDISVVQGQGTELVVNKKAASAMGVTIPEAVVKRASQVVE